MKAVFVIATAEEARFLHPVYQRLAGKGIAVHCIGTGNWCCEESATIPEIEMDALEMGYTTMSLAGNNARTVLDAEKPDVVIVGSDQEFVRRSFVYAADKMDIPALLLYMGICSNAVNTVRTATKRSAYRLRRYGVNITRKYWWLLRTMLAIRMTPLGILRDAVRDIAISLTKDNAIGMFSDCAVAVSGDWGEQSIVHRGINPDRITVVGSPVLASLEACASTLDTGQATRKMLQISSDCKVVLLLTCAMTEHGHWNGDRRAMLVNMVVDALDKELKQGTKLLIKIHPAESIDDYRNIEAIDGNRVILRNGMSSKDAIIACDVVLVGGYSTTVLEAGVLRRPVLLLNLFGSAKAIPYDEMGLAVEVTDSASLTEQATRLLHDANYEETMLARARSFFASNREAMDGDPVERLSSLIIKLAEKHAGERK